MSNQPTRIPENLKTDEDERPVTEEGKVIITKEAFFKMMTHVLRFAHEDLDKSIEVMGVCIGKQEADSIKVVNAVPITHGNKVEVGFSQEDYAAFAKVDEHYSEKGLYSVGWYHSHPGWGLFFSDTDKKNQLSYQSEQSPYGFGIVFDHTLMGEEENLGFDVYRLADPSKGPNSDYVRVTYELEEPNSLNYFDWVKKLVEDTQRKEPVLIKELKEKNVGAPGELQEIPTTEEQEAKSEDKYPQINPVIEGFDEGTAKISEVFLNDLKDQLGMWTKDMNLGVLSGSKHLKNTLTEMEEGFSFGIDKVQEWFESKLGEITGEFKEEVSGYLDKRMNAQEELKTDALEVSDTLSENVEESVSSKLTEILSQVEDRSAQLTESISSIQEKGEKTNSSIEQNSETISKLKTELHNLSDSVKDGLKESGSTLEKNFIKQMKTLSEGVSKLENAYSELEGISKNLKEISMEFRNL
ncbi:MAG: Mov34/MPN/PAD-1 family protein [Promethearchaeia archaeon]